MKIGFGQFSTRFLIFGITEKFKIDFLAIFKQFSILYITESQIRCLLIELCILGSGF